MMPGPIFLRVAIALFVVSSVLVAADKRQTENLILVTADGLRWQEVFRGIDPALMNAKEAGMENAGELRTKLWAESPEQRRRLLLPFVWGELARQGTLLGNRDKGNSVRVANAYRVSYPGYSEILTGRAQDAVIQGNKPIQNPTETVLEFRASRAVRIVGGFSRDRRTTAGIDRDQRRLSRAGRLGSLAALARAEPHAVRAAHALAIGPP